MITRPEIMERIRRHIQRIGGLERLNRDMPVFRLKYRRKL